MQNILNYQLSSPVINLWKGLCIWMCFFHWKNRSNSSATINDMIVEISQIETNRWVVDNHSSADQTWSGDKYWWLSRPHLAFQKICTPIVVTPVPVNYRILDNSHISEPALELQSRAVSHPHRSVSLNTGRNPGGRQEEKKKKKKKKLRVFEMLFPPGDRFFEILKIML